MLATPIGAHRGQSHPRSGRNTCRTGTCAFCMALRAVVRALATAVERLVEGHRHDRFFSPFSGSSIDHQRHPQRCALPPNIAHAPRRISPYKSRSSSTHMVFRGARAPIAAEVRAGAIAAAGSPRTWFRDRITRPPCNPDIISIMMIAAFADVVLGDQSTQREFSTISEKLTRRAFHRAAP